ncbi:MAG: CoA ester lyase [Vicinamibacteria bacterium]
MALLRSYLFAPGHDDKLLARVWQAGADAVVLDLEDAVPESEKPAARRKVETALAAFALAARARTLVRINPLEGPHWRADLEAVTRPGLYAVRVAKAESPDAVRSLDAALTRLERDRGLALGAIEVALTIESARGLRAAEAMATASPRVRNLCFGATDFAADLGLEPGDDEAETLLARSELVLVSRAAQLDPPIASVHRRVEDDEGLRRTTQAARRLGFLGRSCVHPRQLAIVHAAFTPSAEELSRARALVETYERARAAGSGAALAAGGELVDPAVVRRAQKILELAGLVAEEERA